MKKEARKVPKSHPGISVPAGGQGELGPKGPPGMSEQEIEYRTMLQEAILWTTKQLMDEHREEILKRAEARVQTLMELRG